MDQVAKNAASTDYEVRRLQQLAKYDVRAAEGDALLDSLVTLAMQVFNVPTALVSFVEREKQLLKARAGFDRCETDRNISFCSHALTSDEVLVVLDAASDERFASNPLVTGEPGIRFYAGAPLVTPSGYVLGTVCLIDPKPRVEFNENERSKLRSMAAMAMHHLEVKRLSETRRSALCLNRTSNDGIFHMLQDGTVTYANRAAREMFGYLRVEILGKSIGALLPPKLNSRMLASVRRFSNSDQEFQSFPTVESSGVRSNGEHFPIEFSAGIWSSDGSVRMGCIVRDVSEKKQRDASFEMLFERNPVPMWIFNAASLRFVSINDAACALYEYSKSEALRLSALDIRLPEERDAVSVTIANFGEFYQSSVPGTQLTASGRQLRILTFARRLRYGGEDCVLVANIDVTESERSVMELNRTQIFLDAVVESLPSMLFVKDAQDGRFVLLNKAGEKLLGVARQDLIGKTDFDLFAPEDAARFREADKAVITAGEPVTIDNEIVSTPIGRRSLRTQKVGVPDANGSPRYLLGVSEDVTERLKIEDRNRHLSLHDILTDLPNRRAFQISLDAFLAEPKRFGVMLMDLDGFKTINDSLGHQAGDNLLIQLSSRLRATKGDGDFLARLGGDEFGIIHTSSTRKSADRLAKRLANAIRRPYKIDGREVVIGGSVGIALRSDEVSADTLIKRADLALYAAKASSTHRTAFFTPAMEERADTERVLREELAVALQNSQLTVHYQPIVDTKSGKIVCCEALVRWHHPLLGQVPPSDFIPIAETSGLIEPIGKWVLEQACREAANWPADVRVAVNLSPKQFSGFNLPAMVTKALHKAAILPSRLELEITESVFLSNSEDNLRTLNDLKQLGVSIALDDFGTGYSSLAYLSSFSFDKLKIDRSFTDGLLTSPGKLAIVRAVIGLGRSYSAIVTAEGVETEEQYQKLTEKGCDQCQGYLIGRPVSSETIRGILIADSRRVNGSKSWRANAI